MRVIGGEREVPVNSPFEQYLRLVAHVTGAAGFSGLNDIDRRSVDAVVGAFAPEPVPIPGQGELPEQGQFQLRMNVNVVCRTDQRRFAKVRAARKQRAKGLAI